MDALHPPEEAMAVAVAWVADMAAAVVAAWEVVMATNSATVHTKGQFAFTALLDYLDPCPLTCRWVLSVSLRS